MPETVTPNPPSPFADADPGVRHLIPVLIVTPKPGTLAHTGCERLAVVPEETLRDAGAGVLPEGLCPVCLAAMRGDESAAGTRPAAAACRVCGTSTGRDAAVCALCRIEMHAAWVATGRPDSVTLESAVANILDCDALFDHIADGAREHLDEQEAAAAAGIAAGAGPGEIAGEEKYPALIGVFCDTCGTEHKADYVVTDSMTRGQRLEAARAHVRTLGWSCTQDGDYCPACPGPRPPVVVICGSTRFMDQMAEANLRLTAGAGGRRPAIVLAPGCNMKAEHELWEDPADAERLKTVLDELHRAKILMADEVLVVGDYAGDSTRREIAYAKSLGKPMEFTDHVLAAEFGTATVQVGAQR